MKAFSVLPIALLILWATLFKSVAFTAFTLNKEEVVKEQCVQRNADINNCQGSCYLKEKLGLNDEEEQKNKTILVDFSDVVFLEISPLLSSVDLSTNLKSNTPYHFILKSNFYNKRWQPPRHV